MIADMFIDFLKCSLSYYQQWVPVKYLRVTSFELRIWCKSNRCKGWKLTIVKRSARVSIRLVLQFIVYHQTIKFVLERCAKLKFAGRLRLI